MRTNLLNDLSNVLSLRAIRYAAVLFMLFMVGIGNVWGTVQTTYSLGDLSQTLLTYEKSTSEIKLNKGELKVEVPCADAAGTLYLNGGSKQDDRFASVWGSNGTAYDATRQVSMTAGYGSGISFTSSDILTDGGKYYIIFGSINGGTSYDFKIYGFKYTLSSECGSRTFEPGEIVYIKDIKIDGDACMKIGGKNIWAVFVDESGTSSDWAQGDLEKGSWDTEGAIYKMTVPARKNEGKDYIKVIFTRDDWAKQTIDLTTTEPNNLFNLSGTKSGSKFTGSWGFYTPESKTVYFDIRNVTDWMDGGKAAYVRIGHGSWNNAWGAMTKVAGTKYLYSQATSKWDNHTMFAIANTAGWTDGKNIYQPYEEGGNIKPNDSYKMSKQTNYQKYPIISDAYICPSGTSVLERGCQYYKVNSSTSTDTYDNSNRLVSLPSYTVTSTFSNCAIAMVKYTADDGSTTESLPSGGTVKPSQYVKATVTPSTGYKFSAVTLSGTENTDYTIETAAAAGTPGVYSILGNVTINAVCVAKQCSITFDKNGGSGGSDGTTGTYAQAMTTITPPTRDGYIFDGYWDSETSNNGSGNKYYNADGTSAAAWNKDTESATTLYAKWIEISWCYTYTLATSGSAPSAWDRINGTGSGGVMEMLGGTLTYGTNGLNFESGEASKVSVALENNMQVGSVIRIEMVTESNSSRGLKIANSSGTAKATFSESTSGTYVKTYTVVSDDGLAGSNVLQIHRNNNARLKSIKVGNCGSDATMYDLDYTLTNTTKSSGLDEGDDVVLSKGNFTAVFAAADGYNLPDAITVKIGGSTKTVNTDYKWNKSTGKVIILGSKVTGKVEISITSELACSAPAAPTISGTTSYTYGGTITLTASHDGDNHDASTTYRWLKGTTFAGAVQVQAAATGSSGYTFTKTAEMSDAGTYWCEASNGTGCESHNSSGYAITVAKASISPSLSYSSLSLITGDNSSSPTITGNTGSGSVTYAETSATPSGCITVDSGTGVVTAVAAGTGTVTATIAATDNYLGGTATATFTVTDPCFRATITKTSGEYTLSTGNGETKDITSDATVTSGGAVKLVNNYSGSKKFSFSDDGVAPGTTSGYIELIFPTGTILQTGSVIRVQGAGTESGAGLKLVDDEGTVIASQTNNGAIDFTYTVIAASTINGNSHLRIVRAKDSSKNHFKKVTVTNCGEYSCSAPTSAVISGGGAKNQYDAIELTASASGTDESTTYTWYRGNDGEDEAKAAGAIQATSTSGSTYSIASCGTSDAAVYYCVISNGTGCEVTASASISVTARYYLTYDKNTTDEVSNMPERELHTPDTYTLSSKVPTRTGYTFSCWNRNQAGTGDCFNAGALFTTGALDETLYAKWAEITHTVTISGGAHGTASPSSVSGVGIATASGNITATPSTGYTFSSWTLPDGVTAAAGKTSSSNPIQINATADSKTITATYTATSYTITYNLNGGSNPVSPAPKTSYTVEDDDYDLPIPTKDDYVFAGWYDNSSFTGSSIEILEAGSTGNKTYYAKWGDDYDISWGNVQIGGVGDAVTPNLGGGNYTITASVATWTGTLTTSMISTETSGVTITNVAVDNSSSPKTITATFNVGASVAGDEITFSLSVPAAGVYGAKESSTDIDIERCTGGSGSSVYKFQVKTGLGSSATNIDKSVTAATTENYLSSISGGTLSMHLSSNGNIQTIRDSALCLKSTSGYLTPTLSAGTLQRGDIVIYRSENKSMHMMCGTSYSATTDVILPKGNNMVAVSNSMHGRSNVSLTKNDGDVYLKYFEIMRPTSVLFFAEVNAGIGTGNIGSGTTETELTAGDVASGHILSHVSGGKLYTKARSAGYVKGATNEIQLTDGADDTYIKVAISGATLAAGDIIITNSTTTSYPFAITTSAKRSTKLVTSCYTIPVGSGMIGQSTIYLWKNSSSTNLRTVAVVRPGAGGVGVAPTLTWSSGLADKATVSKNTSDDDFTYTASQNTNSLGAITYTSSVPSVATVNASGNVHIVYAGEGVGSTVITATIAASGCYSETSISYTLNVTNSCSDEAGTLTAVDNGCEGVELTLSGYTEDVGATVIKWYKDGEWQDNASYNNKSQITVTTAGEWYAQTTAGGGTGHCPKSSNSVEVTARASVTASKLIDSWYVKKDRRTPDIELVQTTGAVGFFVKIGDTEIWNSDSTTTTGFAGCGFHIGDNGIIYLNGTKDNGDAPAKNDGTWAAGDVTLKITAKGCGGNSDELSITIHKQAATTRPSIAFVVDGTKDGNWDAVTSGHASGTDLYDFLDYTRSGGTGAFDLTERNIYKTTNEKTIREQYSQFDAILITDDPNTGTKDESDKSYVNAFGTMVDIRPILTMEAFVSKLANWKAKGIAGTPDSPNPRQYAIRLECKDHEIYGEGLPVPADGTHVWEEIVGGETYRYVIMVDSTKGVYDGVAYNVETAGDKKPALQGFDGTAAGTLLGLGRIADGSLQAAIERQEEPAARLLVFGVNAKALRPTSALTTEGKIIIENILEYLLKTNMEEVDDCSNYFTGKTSTDWNTEANWSKGSLPSSETKVRILAPCVVSGVTAHVAQVDIVSSGESSIRYAQVSEATCNGKLTINADGALIVGGEVLAAEAPHFAHNDLKPTTVNDLVLNTSSANQAALIFNNDEGKTQATVNLYSLGRTVSETNQFQYFAIPMSYLSVNPTFANETHGITIYTYVWLEATGWERRGYYTDLYAFEGIGITTDQTTAHEYTMKGTLASTKDQEIPITADGKKLNLIGNSWTAPIQISELEASDFGDASVEQTVYIYCAGHGNGTADGKTEAAGQWLAIPFEATRFDAWDGLKVIPSMQAFQIKTAGEGTLTLDYDKHVRGGSTDLTAKLRAPQRRAAHDGVELMRIRVADSKTHTDLYLFEGDQFSDAFDNGWEANYRVGTNESAKLYARVATGVMSVAAMSDLEGTPIYFIPGQETEYTFTFGGNGMGYYLNDLKLQQSTLISEGAEYSFTYEKGDAAARFMISATPYESPQVTTGTENVQTEEKPRKILYNNKLYIIYNGHVYSAEGAIVK